MISFMRGRLSGDWIIAQGGHTRAKMTIEYFYNGHKPILWSFPDDA